MILHFKISNYKSFKDERTFNMISETSKLNPDNVHEIKNKIGQKFRISKVSIIYGPNASGKTNLLNALTNFVSFILSKPELGERIRIYSPFGFNLQTFRAPTNYELLFLGPQGIKYEYKVSVSKNSVLKEELNYFPEIEPVNLFKRQSASLDGINVEKCLVGDRTYAIFNNQLLLSTFATEPHDILSNVYLYFKSTFNLSVCKSNYNINLRDESASKLLKDTKLLNALNNLFKISDTKVLGVRIKEEKDTNSIKFVDIRVGKTKSDSSKQNYTISLQHPVFKGSERFRGMALLPFSQASKGSKTLFTLGTAILQAINEGQTIIVDELDSSLHPYITKMLVLLFISPDINTKGAQLIFNSHDVTLLDSELFRKDQIWIVDKNDEGISDLFCLNDFEGLRDDTPFEKWYLAGKFGGLPNISDLKNIFEDVS